jgi:hypothetical protein
MCCSGSSQCAIGCPLSDVSVLFIHVGWTTCACGWAGRREGVSLNRKCKSIPSSKAFPSSSISPHPLHGYTTSSWSSGDSGYAPGDSMLLYGDVCRYAFASGVATGTSINHTAVS